MAVKKRAPRRRKAPLSVCVFTGSRAEFGLLRPVMRAIEGQRGLRLRVVAGGSHLLPPARTIDEVKGEFRVDAVIQMQRPREKRTRAADARDTGRGITACAEAFAKLKPDWVVVLGDRIEAFAAASAASIAGIAVAHIHGGDRAEGIADEAMRHAVSKMSHLHFAATEQSGERLVRMGEREEHVHVVGSPALDGLDEVEAMSSADAEKLGDPRVIVLLHPSGLVPGTDKRLDSGSPERHFAIRVVKPLVSLGHEMPLGPCRNLGQTECGGFGPRVLLMEPNQDAGRGEIMESWRWFSRMMGWPITPHLPRAVFLSLLKRMARDGRGFVLGNSSAGLIECGALGVPVLNVGPRQNGRERGENVVDADPLSFRKYERVMQGVDGMAGEVKRSRLYGDGRSGERIAEVLAGVDPAGMVRKRNSY